MGRDKARLRLGKRTLLGHVRKAAKVLNVPVRVIRRDLVERCGPIGGVYTGLATTEAEAVLFLACDMPFISEELLREVIENLSASETAVFTQTDSPGFPFIMKRAALPAVQQQIARMRFSLHKLAKQLDANILKPKARVARRLFNVNTPEDWDKARALMAETEGR